MAISLGNAQIFGERFLTIRGSAELSNRGIQQGLAAALNDQDLDIIISHSIFFCAVFSPASISTGITLPENSRLISLDLNTLDLFQAQERIAIVLHELGHATTAIQRTGVQMEFDADDYAVARGMRLELISSLQRAIMLSPNLFRNGMTNARIERLNTLMP